MRTTLAAILCVLSIPLFAHAQTHCRKGEVDFFSCPVSEKKKVMSICGNIRETDEISKDSWVQYRYGRIGRVELIYPTEKDGSPTKFEGNDFVKFSDKLLFFINGKILYEIGVFPEEEWDDGKERIVKKRTAGVTVFLNKTQYVNIECQKVDLDKYLQRLSYLIRRLREHNGNTDFKGHFFNSTQ